VQINNRRSLTCAMPPNTQSVSSVQLNPLKPRENQYNEVLNFMQTVFRPFTTTDQTEAVSATRTGKQCLTLQATKESPDLFLLKMT
jgi:hypothetical protein